jgi:ligand-binding sensor domain-containing protein/serine phosphatase RsbU (regulator of sigma subunit)
LSFRVNPLNKMPVSLAKIISCFAIFQIAAAVTVQAQYYSFRNYGIEEGIPHGYVYTVNQDASGFLWVGTGTDLVRFNGFEFEINPTADSLPADFVNTSFRDTRGRIWFGHNNGSISLLEEGIIRVLDNNGMTTRITGIAEDHDGNIVIASQQHGLLVADRDLNMTLFRDSVNSFPITAIAFASETEFMAGTFEGLYSLSWQPGKEPELQDRIPGVPVTTIECIHSFGERGLFVGTRDRGLFHLNKEDDGYNVTNLGYRFGFGGARVQSVLVDDRDDIWVSTWGRGVFRISGFFSQDLPATVQSFSMINGLAANFVHSVFQDSEGNYWFPTFNGLSMLSDESFSYYRTFEEPFGRNVLAVWSDQQYMWLGGESGLLRISREDKSSRDFYGTGRGLPFDMVTALVSCSDGHLWIGTRSSGIYKLEKDGRNAYSFFVSPNSPENSINDLAYNNGILNAATNNGVFEFNLKGGEVTRYGTPWLPHNLIRGLHTDPDGTTWVATRSNRMIDSRSSREIRVLQGEIEFSAITRDHDDRLWAATSSGNGILMVTPDSIVQIITGDGLHSNFCYSLVTCNDGFIWVGHKLGVSRINPRDYSVRTFGTESGIRGDFNPNAAHMTSDGILLFGTSGGLVSYDPSKAKDCHPPRVSLTSILITDEEHPLKNVSLPYGSYKLRLEFIGLNYTAPEKVRYQYKLEGHDLDWSDISDQRFAYYSRVDDGHFEFLIRAYNAEGVIGELTGPLAISVDRPIWKKWYFFLFVALGAGLTLFLAFKIRERNLRLEKERIERELAIRTKEVIEQKREIEHKNRDITDSINYAQRIQVSILPPVSRIEENFTESFVFYQPRDIVSGDFYWFDRVNEHKFLIVCADSTGHGVPGAFMSMIGTTLIKDICMRPDVGSPSEVLATLDREITSTLNQNVEPSLKSTDGMDITVCEFDLTRNYLRFASAMRPIIMYHKNELMYIRGSRSSIGGYATHEKAFENQGFQLHRGDIIYLFSDGYPDQFGGPLGKKFKMVRLKNLLGDICNIPMKEQYEHVSNNFKLWKGEHEQVDDVLFMAVKI